MTKIDQSEAIRRRIEAAMSGVSVCVSAEVRAYQGSDQTVTVRLKVADPGYSDGETSWRDAPEYAGIPVAFFRAGGVSFTAEPSVGDVGLLLVRDRSHDEVDSGQGDGPVVTPASVRRWAYDDGVFVPVQVVPADPLGSGAVSADGAVLAMGAGLKFMVGDSAADKALAVAEKSAARIERIEAYLNTATYAVAGAATAAPMPAPFTGTTSVLPLCVASVGTPAPATTTSDVASTRIFTDDA